MLGQTTHPSLWERSPRWLRPSETITWAPSLEFEADQRTGSPACANIANFDFELPDDWRRRMRSGLQLQGRARAARRWDREAKNSNAGERKWFELTRLG